MKSLHTRAVVTADELQRLGPLGAFDWAAAKMRDAVAAERSQREHGYILELWLDDRELTRDGETG